MTQIQKIIAFSSGKQSVLPGEKVSLVKADGAVSATDTLCGIYGALYTEKNEITVPEGIFIDLCGALRDDAKSPEVAEFLFEKLKDKIQPDISLEFGGDSMTYLTADDRAETIKAFLGHVIRPFSVSFECDYIAAEYKLEKFGTKPRAFYNDGPESYTEVIHVDISDI